MEIGDWKRVTKRPIPRHLSRYPFGSVAMAYGKRRILVRFARAFRKLGVADAPAAGRLTNGNTTPARAGLRPTRIAPASVWKKNAQFASLRAQRNLRISALGLCGWPGDPKRHRRERLSRRGNSCAAPAGEAAAPLGWRARMPASISALLSFATPQRLVPPRIFLLD